MAEVQVKEEGGGKNKQKKKHLRVDFTPMVDMNMLLITFFMFCTTLLKPQTMNINMPSDKEDIEDPNQVRKSTAVTLLLGANDEIYYYEGLIDDEAYANPTDFLKHTGYGDEGLRQLLLEKNKGTYELIQELKKQLKNLEIKEEEFYAQSGEIQRDAIKDKKIAPSVMIKPTEFSTYKNMVDALDEMLVCNIGSYTIMDIADGDRHLLYTKTGNLDYLTEDQKTKLAAATARK